MLAALILQLRYSLLSFIQVVQQISVSFFSPFKILRNPLFSVHNLLELRLESPRLQLQLNELNAVTPHRVLCICCSIAFQDINFGFQLFNQLILLTELFCKFLQSFSLLVRLYLSLFVLSLKLQRQIIQTKFILLIYYSQFQ